MYKKILMVITLVLSIILTNGCSNGDKGAEYDTYTYSGKGDHWLAVYTITNVEEDYYGSLYIQYLDRNDWESVGKIAYKLEGASHILSSKSAKLKGIGDFQVAIGFQPFDFDYLKKAYKVELSWQDTKETINLLPQFNHHD